MSRIDAIARAMTAQTTPGTLLHAWVMARASYAYSRHSGLSAPEALQGARDLFKSERTGK